MSNHHGHDGQGGKCNRLEAVTVCIGYADFLAVTAKINRGLFDDWIIITSKEDNETRELCRKLSLRVLLTEDHKRGGEFNKGRVIERGLQHLSALGWRVHLDADIILPTTFRQITESSYLDEDNIYGCDRILCKDRSDWERLKGTGWLSNDYHCRVNFPRGFDIGTRWAHHSEGYVPIGFFQMWHSSMDQFNGSRIKPYPKFHNDACRTDVQFALQWDRQHRVLLPELLVVHLESEKAAMGTNWNGRKTKRF